MTRRGEVLIAVMNSWADWDIVRTRCWYRIPMVQVEKLKQQGYWSPQCLAFYQTKVFGTEAYAIHYYAQVNQVGKVYRWELFPEQPRDAKSEQRYCKLELSPLKVLSQPIVSQHLRRIAFIATTWEQFTTARAIEELLTY